MPQQHQTESEDTSAHIITIRDDGIFNYSDVMDKIAGRKQPQITQLLRGKPFNPGVYKVRDGRTKRMTGERIEILTWERILWIKLSNQQAQSLLGTDKAPIFGTYIRDLRRYFGRHEMAYANRPIMYLHTVRYLPRPVQHNLKDLENNEQNSGQIT